MKFRAQFFFFLFVFLFWYFGIFVLFLFASRVALMPGKLNKKFLVDAMCVVCLVDLFQALCDKRGIKLSYMPFIIKATSMALREFPILNAHTNADCSEVVYKGAHNIGMLVINLP